jgi:hypothetical protein
VECKVCGIAHDPQIHAAVLRIRAWVRARLTLVRGLVTSPQQEPHAFRPPLGSITSLLSPAARQKKAAAK